MSGDMIMMRSIMFSSYLDTKKKSENYFPHFLFPQFQNTH